MLYPCKSGWNLPISSCDMVHTSTFWLKFGSLSSTVTLKIRSKSPKPNQLFIMSHCYIHANLVTIHPLVHEISCKQESVTLTPTPTLTPTGSPQKQYVPLPFSGGHNKCIKPQVRGRQPQGDKILMLTETSSLRSFSTSFRKSLCLIL